MATYIGRRFVLLPLVAFGVTLLIFALLQFLAPEMRAAAFVTNPNQLKAIDKIIVKYGLDRPIHVQYYNWLREVFRGNLGWSQTARLPVAQAIGAFFPATMELTLYSFIPIMVMGVWLGTAAAVHRDKLIDHISRIFSISFRSLPSFVWGLLILMILYGRLNWFPPGRLSLEADLFVRSGQFHFYSRLMTVDALLNGKFWIFLDALRHLMGPVLTLTMISIALLVRVTRSSMLEVLRQDYVRTARAEGLDEDGGRVGGEADGHPGRDRLRDVRRGADGAGQPRRGHPLRLLRSEGEAAVAMSLAGTAVRGVQTNWSRLRPLGAAVAIVLAAALVLPVTRDRLLRYPIATAEFI